MTQFMKPSFSVQMGGNQSYRDRFDAIDWGNKEEDAELERYKNSSIDDTNCHAGPSTNAYLRNIPGTIQHQVRQFHEVYNQPVYEHPNVPAANRIDLRLNLIVEEVLELLSAAGVVSSEVEFLSDMFAKALVRRTGGFDLVEVADALADIAYVVEGMNLELGINSEAVLAEVQRSNLSKLDPEGNPVYNMDGKVIKGPNYSPPDLNKVLFAKK